MRFLRLMGVGARPMRRSMSVALAVFMTMAVLATGPPGVAEGAATWTQVGADIDGEAAGDLSSCCWSSMAMSSDGDTVIIGARSNDGNGSNAGHARIYDWNGTAWAQRGTDIDGEAAGDLSGYTVAMSSDGNTVIIGARHSDGNGSNAGHARIYDWNGTAWAQRGTDIDGEAADDWSAPVAMSSDGNTVIIGATRNDGNGSDAGHARIYDWNGTAWVQRGTDIDGEAANDSFGYAVAMSSDGNTVIIGAIWNHGNGLTAGHARIYDWNGTAWAQRGIDIDGEAARDESGRSVAMSSDGNTVIVGAASNDGNGSRAGHARIYDWNGTAWAQRGTDIDGEAADDQSGIGVAMSSDGNTVIIGAPFNDGNGSDAGHARIYIWNGTAWVQRGADIDGEAAGDWSGYTVAMSSDGDTIIVGAGGNDGNGSNAGHARIYRFAEDATPPVISASVSGTLGNDGWYTSDVTVTWTVTDDESSITSTSGCESTTIVSDTTGLTLTCTATSAGGTGSASVTIKRDATAPTVEVVVDPNPVLQGLSATVTSTATDSTSGVDPASESCGSVETTTPGTFGVSCSATDVAGNTATVTVFYEVLDPASALEVALVGLDAAATTDPDAAAALEEAALLVEEAIGFFDAGQEEAALGAILDAIEKIEEAEAADATLDLTEVKAALASVAKAEAADATLDLTEVKAALASVAKSVAVTGIADAEASGTTKPAELRKIAAAQELVAEGDALFAAGDYLAAAEAYTRAYLKVKDIGGGDTPPTDDPPTVNVTDPAEGATVSGDTVLVAATASDDNGVTQVEFFVDGISIGVGTAAPYSATWDSTTVDDGTYLVTATVTDTIGQTSSDSHNVTVDNVPDPTMHIGDLDGATSTGRGGKWNATVTVTVHDSGEALVPNATVEGSWSNGATGSGSCVTSGGECSITKGNINKNSSSVTFTVTSVTHATLTYASGSNHDPDGDSNGTTIVVAKPS